MTMTLIVNDSPIKVSATAAKMMKNIASGKHFIATQSDVPTLKRLVGKGLVHLKNHEDKVLMGLTLNGIKAVNQIR